MKKVKSPALIQIALSRNDPPSYGDANGGQSDVSSLFNISSD